jgi:hypothetical protein
MKLRRALLACGVLSSLVYVGVDQVAAVQHPGYHSFMAQTISELGARGAPTKATADAMFILYDLLTIAFGVGVWWAAGGSRALRVSGAMWIALGVAGLPGPWLFPMNLRGVGGDEPHIVATGVMVLLIVTGVLFGGFARGRAFRLYSFATVLATLTFGMLTGLQAKALVTGAPTPWIGLTERICIGAFLLWLAVLAVTLLRAAQRRATPTSPRDAAAPPHPTPASAPA